MKTILLIKYFCVISLIIILNNNTTTTTTRWISPQSTGRTGRGVWVRRIEGEYFNNNWWLGGEYCHWLGQVEPKVVFCCCCYIFIFYWLRSKILTISRLFFYLREGPLLDGPCLQSVDSFLMRLWVFVIVVVIVIYKK